MSDLDAMQFRKNALERLGKIVADLYSSSEITDFFLRSGFPEFQHDGSTKRLFVYNTLDEIQREHGFRNVIHIIEMFCDPEEHFGQMNRRDQIVADIAEILNFYGLDVDSKTGRVIKYESKQLVEGNNQASVQQMPSIEPPIEIQRSLAKFQKSYPDPKKVAFIMMEYGRSSPYDQTLDLIKETLAKKGITALRADDFMFHTHVYFNVLTYMYGCGLGIALFEEFENKKFNPNVALEVGYMFALQKPVCLLKDARIETLYSDLFGRIYIRFDSYDPKKDIPKELLKWLRDEELGSLE